MRASYKKGLGSLGIIVAYALGVSAAFAAVDQGITVAGALGVTAVLTVVLTVVLALIWE